MRTVLTWHVVGRSEECKALVDQVFVWILFLRQSLHSTCSRSMTSGTHAKLTTMMHLPPRYLLEVRTVVAV